MMPDENSSYSKGAYGPYRTLGGGERLRYPIHQVVRVRFDPPKLKTRWDLLKEDD